MTSIGNYIDAAVMAALSSQRLKTPILLAGAQVSALADAVDALYGAHVVQRQP